MLYAEKLKDPRWQRRRLEVLERDNFTCELCGATHKTLHVHHGYYANDMDPWDYAMSSLHCVCEDCHDVADATRVELRDTIGRMPLRVQRRLVRVIGPLFLEDTEEALSRISEMIAIALRDRVDLSGRDCDPEVAAQRWYEIAGRPSDTTEDVS